MKISKVVLSVLSAATVSCSKDVTIPGEKSENETNSLPMESIKKPVQVKEKENVLQPEDTVQVLDDSMEIGKRFYYCPPCGMG